MKNIGRFLRTPQDLLHVGPLQDEVRGAGRGEDDVGALQVDRELVEPDRGPFELLGEAHRALVRPVRDEDTLRARGEQVTRRQLAHLPGPDEHHRLVREVSEDLPRELHRGVGDGDRAVGQPGLRADPLGHRERLREELVEHRTDRLELAGVPVGVLHLPEDLRLPEDHRIEAAGDAEQVTNRLFAEVVVEVARQLGDRHAVVGGEELLYVLHALVSLAGKDAHLDPVAGGEDDPFGDAGALPEPPEGMAHGVRREREALPDLHRRGPVVQADDDDFAHARCRPAVSPRGSSRCAGPAGAGSRRGT